ncbi:MAG: hypothetical protein HZC44_04335 [Geobacter sp.]|nr:hypothetical protein [Geobacter sp.]
MIQHPAILSLLVSSVIISLMILYAGWHGLRIVRSWDLASGSEKQLRLERTTYLISTILGYSLFFQILSLFLYIFTADYLHGQFVGAMCAAGSLNANGFGYPVLILKIVTCLFAGAWLIINHADGKGYDIFFLSKGKGGYLFAGVSTLTFVIAIASLISFISLYIYALPTHHCPFCILQKEYGYVGYPLYATLLGAGICGLGVGALMPARKRQSLARTVMLFQRKLAAIALVLYLLFTLIVAYQMAFSALEF